MEKREGIKTVTILELKCISCLDWTDENEWHVKTCGSYDNITYICPKCGHEHKGQTAVQ
jgi:hypothetical protein